MERGRGWVLGWAAIALLAAARVGWAELQVVRSARVPGGAHVVLEFSAAPRLRAWPVHDADGGLTRLYVDLAPGTAVAHGLVRTVTGAGPVRGVRVGLGDGGRPRVVVDLAGAARYELQRHARGRGVTVVVMDAPVSAVAPRPPAVRARAVAPPPRVSTGRRIVLDPGHGGRDPGAQGFAVEKEVTLAITRELGRLLRERLGAEVVMTRTGDTTLTLAERTARANAEDADLFVSVHANAQEGDTLHGIETYYLDNTEDRATMRLAALENGLGANAPVTKGRSDLRYILSDLVQVGKMDESIALARAVQLQLVDHLRGRYAGIEDLGVKRGPFYVLVGAHMPCILVETSFLTHPVEGRRLATQEYQRAVAEGVYAGIARFVGDDARVRTL